MNTTVPSVPYGLAISTTVDAAAVRSVRDVITKHSVTVRVHAVTYLNVTDPVKAVVAIQDHHYATSEGTNHSGFGPRTGRTRRTTGQP